MDDEDEVLSCCFCAFMCARVASLPCTDVAVTGSGEEVIPTGAGLFVMIWDSEHAVVELGWRRRREDSMMRRRAEG